MSNKISLINQALSAADSSIKLARQLLTELEEGPARGGFREQRGNVYNQPSTPPEQKVKEKPGTIGIFDGENMVTETGEKHLIPEAYASKSMLVSGDTLKMVDEGGEKRFKQIEHVKRYRTTGILTKKEGKFRLVTPEGSYKILPSTIEHYKGDVGDEAVAYLPAGNLTTIHAAIESITKKTSGEEKGVEKEPLPTEVKVAKVKESKAIPPQEKVTKPVKEEKVEIKMPEVAEDELR